MARACLRFWNVSKRFRVLSLMRSEESARVTTMAIYARCSRTV